MVMVVKPTYCIGKIICSHDHSRWYNLSLVVDNEVIEEHNWCLGLNGFKSESIIAEDILNAFQLNGYKLHQRDHKDLQVLVDLREDFELDLWQDAIVQ